MKRDGVMMMLLLISLLLAANGHAGRPSASLAAVQALKNAAVLGDVVAAQHLLDEGANPNEGRPDNKTSLMLAINGMSPLQMMKLLLPRMRALDDVDSEGFSALHYAATTGDSRLVRTLMEAANSSRRALDVNGRDNNLQTPLFIAINDGDWPDVVETLIEFGQHHEMMRPRVIHVPLVRFRRTREARTPVASSCGGCRGEGTPAGFVDASSCGRAQASC